MWIDVNLNCRMLGIRENMKITRIITTPINIPLEKPSVDVLQTIHHMGEVLTGSDPLDIAGCEALCVPPWQIVQNTDDNSVVKAFGAIEIALWDLRGKVAGEPLYRLLGGAVRKEIPFTEYFGFREGGEMSPEVVPEGPGLGVTLDTDALKYWHDHFSDNGPLDHFYDPAMPVRFRRLPLN